MGFIKKHTKGDAMKTAYVLPITKDNILGEVVGVIPKLGLLSKWITAGGGLIECELYT